MLYHHTPQVNRESIRRNGLLRSKAEAMGGIFFTDVPSLSENMDVWAVDCEGIELEDDFTTDAPEGEKWFVTFDHDLAPSRLTLQTV